MNLKKSSKTSVFFVALATALCLAATTPALARGGFGGHGGGGPHFGGGGFGGFHGPSMQRYGGGYRAPAPQMRGGYRGQGPQMGGPQRGYARPQFGGRGGPQGRNAGPGGDPRGNFGQRGQRGGVPPEGSGLPHHELPHGFNGPQGRVMPQAGMVPPQTQSQDINPLELIGEVFQMFGGGGY